MRSKFLINPFTMYIISFGTVLMVYQLGWSDRYPILSANLIAFLIITMIIMGVIAYFFHSVEYFAPKLIKYNTPLVTRLLAVNYFLLFIEFAAAGTIPLYSYLTGGGFIYTEFGLPIIHIIVANLFPALFAYSVHGYISSPKKNRKKVAILIFLCFIPALLIFNRALMLYELFTAMIILMMHAKSIKRWIFAIIISGITILFLFGALGNLRTDTKTAKNLILEIGGANTEFKKSWVPEEFFWAYLYIATPLGNVQHTINEKIIIEPSPKTLLDFPVNNLTPQVISKRIAPILNTQRENYILIIPELNVASVYASPYADMGWTGMWITFFFTIFFIFTTLILLPKSSPYFITGVALICTLIFFNLFTNMLTNMSLIPQLIFPIIMSLPYLKQKKSITHLK